MSKEEKLFFKTRLKQYCEQAIRQRIAFTQAAMESAQAAANGEEKSSAGDKYETSRAMNHLEKDMHARQLAAHLQELGALNAVNVNLIYNTAVTGALIQCGNISFFVAAGLGKQLIDGVSVFFLSPQSLLAKELANRKAGDLFPFNGSKITVSNIY